MSFSCKTFLSLALVILLSLVFFGCSSGPQAAQKKIDKIAETMKSKLPQKLDDDTMLVNVYTKEMELVSVYQLLNYESGIGDFKATKNNIELFLRKNVCPGIKKELLSKGIKARYIYSAKDGQIIINRLLSSGDC